MLFLHGGRNACISNFLEMNTTEYFTGTFRKVHGILFPVSANAYALDTRDLSRCLQEQTYDRQVT